MPELLIQRRPFEMEDPWSTAGATSAPLMRATDGAAPRLATNVAATWDDEAVTFVFRGEDDAIVATLLDHDAPLWKEDVVEIFLATSSAAEYFELEVNPLGTTFDARIISPDGVRATMRAELEWECAGLFAAIRRNSIDGQRSEFETVVRIPFTSLGCGVPRSGDAWRGNLFRIDRHEGGDEFCAWSPTMCDPADFHVAAAFGTWIFG
jgi:hypothetical protein